LSDVVVLCCCDAATPTKKNGLFPLFRLLLYFDWFGLEFAGLEFAFFRPAAFPLLS
jgi:hypothetical protein